MREKIIEILISDKVVSDMKRIYPGWEINGRVKHYYETKIRFFMAVFIAGIVLSVMTYFSENLNREYEKIERNGYLLGDKSVALEYEIEDTGDTSEVNVDVSEKRYTKETLNGISEGFKEALVRQILGTNISQDEVRNDLVFEEKVGNYPFSVRYRTDDPVLISKSGKINVDRLIELSENSDEGIHVQITANASYKDYEEEIIFFVNVLQPVFSDKERYDRYLKTIVKSNDEKTVEEDYMYLPKEIDGKEITFYRKKSNTAFIIFAVFTVASFVVYFGKDKDLEKEIDKRNSELAYEYPSFINKFTLFYNAGMPIKTIWLRMCSDYEKEKEQVRNKRILYEEMLVTRAKILDGVKEIEAYEEFAKRVDLPKYRLFISLIEQSVVKGKKDLSIELKKEADIAFTERKNNAKRLLEEASTKLLIPMFMMLLVIMGVVVYPAFMSFSR